MNHKEVEKIARRIARRAPKDVREAIEMDVIEAIYNTMSDCFKVTAQMAEMNYGVTKHEQFLVMARTFWRRADDPRWSPADDDRPIDETNSKPS